MNKLQVAALSGLLTLNLLACAQAQDYPRYKPKPKPSPTAKATPSPEASPAATPAATPKAPTGPLKMIKTDGKNKDSPIKVTDLQYYDSGFGSKYNSEVRVSCAIQNTDKKAELKKVTLYLQIIDGAKQVIHEWKQPVGNMKPGQVYKYNPGVWYNSLGTNLNAQVMVEHEEVPKEDAGDAKPAK